MTDSRSTLLFIITTSFSVYAERFFFERFGVTLTDNKLWRLDGSMIQAFVNDFESRGVADLTKIQYIRRMNRFFSWTHEMGYTKTNLSAALWEILSRIQKSANVQTGVHNFRHTVLTNIAKNNTTGVAAVIAGHSSSQVMEKYYIHSDTEDREKVIDGLTLNEVLKPHRSVTKT